MNFMDGDNFWSMDPVGLGGQARPCPDDEHESHRDVAASDLQAISRVDRLQMGDEPARLTRAGGPTRNRRPAW